MINLQFVTGFLLALLIGMIFSVMVYLKFKKQQQVLKDKHNQFMHLVETPNDFIYYAEVQPEVKFLYLSPSAENFFGEGSNAKAYISSEVVFINIHPDDYHILMAKLKGDADYSKPIIQRWKDKDGTYRWFEEYATPVYKKGKLLALQGVLRNIDERVVLQEKLTYQLYHDVLTNIYNRAYFELVFEKYNEKRNTSVAIILCDLDELKSVNDNYGHKQGDILIRETAQLLDGFSSDSVTVARIGGDEFILFMEVASEIEVDLLVKSIKEQIDELNIRLSIGYAFTPNSQGEMSQLFSLADHNMYMNKDRRKVNV
ncbi:sensor domain-containing diguanylate cyclase [Halalkalibacter suaedae]|uniref:GGDEF domain-containing protein n=1 Tax=Halalkalibacter suaedae TaxID=2822140 RepID=A0A941APK8_9BACI|nr:sensor domain-containing diguanylate cyclase [Bacillus suaedae]MBP3950218.1 GGDEF domain-containing protein [Bacillus suaedae]